MEKILNPIALALLFCIVVAVYTQLSSNILPKLFLRLHFDLSESLGRGLKKFTYPEGRAVVYEPHPSIRKYVRRYALYTAGGFKYLKMKLDRDVKSLGAVVVMFDNKNRQIDTLSLNGSSLYGEESPAVLLHHRTSYVSLTVISVNGVELERRPPVYYHWYSALIYVTVYAILTFFLLLFTVRGGERVLPDIFPTLNLRSIDNSALLLSAIQIAIGAFLIIFFHRRKKGIRLVLKNER